MGLRQLAVCAGCGQGLRPCGSRAGGMIARRWGGCNPDRLIGSERARRREIASRKPIDAAPVPWVRIDGIGGSGASCGPARGM